MSEVDRILNRVKNELLDKKSKLEKLNKEKSSMLADLRKKSNLAKKVFNKAQYKVTQAKSEERKLSDKYFKFYDKLCEEERPIKLMRDDIKSWEDWGKTKYAYFIFDIIERVQFGKFSNHGENIADYYEDFKGLPEDVKEMLNLWFGLMKIKGLDFVREYEYYQGFRYNLIRLYNVLRGLSQYLWSDDYMKIIPVEKREALGESVSTWINYTIKKEGILLAYKEILGSGWVDILLENVKLKNKGLAISLPAKMTLNNTVGGN